MIYQINTDLLSGEAYTGFMKVAFERSDLISIRVDWPYEKGLPPKEQELSLGVSEAVYDMCVKSYYERVYPKIQLFKQKKIPWLRQIEPYFMNGDTLSDKKWVYHLYPSEDILPLFLSVGSINNWKYPYYPEDISFARNGEYWFKSISHEDYAQLAVSNADEYAFWHRLGIRFYEEEYQ